MSLKPDSRPMPVTDRSLHLTRGRLTTAWLALGSFAALIAAQVYSIRISPAEGDMGHLQKIMYVHVPAAWMTFLASSWC